MRTTTNPPNHQLVMTLFRRQNILSTFVVTAFELLLYSVLFKLTVNFTPKQNLWMWEFEDDKLKDKVMTYIDNNKSKYDLMKNVENKKAKNIIHENMNKCVLTLQFAISKHIN